MFKGGEGQKIKYDPPSTLSSFGHTLSGQQSLFDQSFFITAHSLTWTFLTYLMPQYKKKTFVGLFAYPPNFGSIEIQFKWVNIWECILKVILRLKLTTHFLLKCMFLMYWYLLYAYNVSYLSHELQSKCQNACALFKCNQIGNICVQFWIDWQNFQLFIYSTYLFKLKGPPDQN